MKKVMDLLTGGGLGSVINKFVKDKDAAIRLEAELTSTLVNASRDVIVAEAQGGSWIQRSWRPITMLTFVFIIANNYIIVPYVQAFGASVPSLDIPNGMWALLNVGIGGYIAGRSGEKMVQAWQNKEK